MHNIQIRPQTLSEFFGKDIIKNNLKIFINASIKENRILDHLLFYGQAGTGKTTLAFIVANVLKRKIKIIQGTQLKQISDLINFISLVTEGDVIFIDELHAMNVECMETLYSIMEDFTIDILIGRDKNAKSTRVDLPHFTLIGATTNANKILKPLFQRFGINFYFECYEENEIEKIISRSSKLQKINLTEEQIEIIASYSKGNPRIANRLVKRINDYFVSGIRNLNEIFTLLDIHEYGLEKIDIIYLQALYQNDDFMGLKSLNIMTNIDQPTIENQIEPFLITKKLISKTPRGRMINQKGRDILLNKM